jgi:hypothetical protein
MGAPQLTKACKGLRFSTLEGVTTIDYLNVWCCKSSNRRAQHLKRLDQRLPPQHHLHRRTAPSWPFLHHRLAAHLTRCRPAERCQAQYWPPPPHQQAAFWSATLAARCCGGGHTLAAPGLDPPWTGATAFAEVRVYVVLRQPHPTIRGEGWGNRRAVMSPDHHATPRCLPTATAIKARGVCPGVKRPAPLGRRMVCCRV